MPDDGPWAKYAAAPAAEDGPWAKYGGSKTTEAEQVAQRPDAIAQARKVRPPGLIETRRAMQQTMGGAPMFVDVPADDKESFESAGRRGYATGAKAGMASLALPSLFAAPAATALSLLGGTAGSYLGSEASRSAAEALGADPSDAEAVGDVGGAIGGFAGGFGASKLPSSRNQLANLLRNPATARQSQLGKPGTVKSLFPSSVQKWAVPDWLVPKGDVGTPTNPGPFAEIPVRAPKAIPTKMPKPAATESALIVSPSAGSSAGEPRFTGSEGRAATWTNERVLSEAARGNRVAIEQANRRGLELPPNARYVMGDPDLPRAVYNPKETTIFSPEGTPIRNVDNPTVQAPRQRITLSGKAPQEPTSPSLDFEQTLKVPSETPLSEAVQPQKPTPLAVQPERRVSNVGPSAAGRRQADIDYQRAIQSTPPGTPTPGEQLSEDIRQARAGQPSGTTEGEALQRIMSDPDRYEQYRAADQKTRDRMLITAKNELSGKSATPLAVQPASLEQEPVDTEIKGITAPTKKTPLAVRPKSVPIERRFSSDEITEAEGLLASESGAMGSADRPGTYFDQSEPGDVRTGSRQIRGGDWRGVKSGRQMYPFMREHPEWGPEAVQKALRNKDSAAYRKMMEAAMEFLKRGRDVEADERAAIQEE